MKAIVVAIEVAFVVLVMVVIRVVVAMIVAIVIAVIIAEMIMVLVLEMLVVLAVAEAGAGLCRLLGAAGAGLCKAPGFRSRACPTLSRWAPQREKSEACLKIRAADNHYKPAKTMTTQTSLFNMVSSAGLWLCRT